MMEDFLVTGRVRLGRRTSKRPVYCPPTPIQMIRACRNVERSRIQREESGMTVWEQRFVDDISQHHNKLGNPHVFRKVQEIYYKRVLLFTDLEYKSVLNE